jgi:diguanylate cyclase (GGDEF)-like protein
MTVTAGFRRRLLAGSFLVLVALLAALAWVGHGRVLQRPFVRVAFNRFPPYLDKGPDGTPTGFAAKIFAQAARQANVDIRWVEIPGSADAAFAAGQADMYPLMTITPERETQFYMSAPWWVNQFALISTEGRAIPDAAAAKGKLIATRMGVIQTLSQKLFPEARFVDMTTLTEMETALCEGKIDGFFSDVRLLQAQLLLRTSRCAGQALRATSVPDGRLFLGAASTKEMTYTNDRIFREIAKLALDGTLSRTASQWGIFTPYDTARLKQVVDAQAEETRMGWALAATLFVLVLSVTQTIMIKRAKRAAEAAQAEAREIRYRFDEFMSHTPALTFIKDDRGQVVYSNEEFCCPGGPGSAHAISHQLSQSDGEVLEFGRNVQITETLPGQDGLKRHFLVLKFPFRGASGARFLGGVALDVTARIVAEEELAYHAKSDLLTGLPNRRSFMTELESALERSKDRAEGLALGFIDLDGFKRVNDLMGHEAGDELLQQAAARLKQFCGGPDFVARLGGDEFTLFLCNTTKARSEQILVAALRALEEPFRIGGKEIFVSASVGVSLFPEHGSAPPQLLRNADSAMYSAKRKGKGRIEFWSRSNTVEQQPALEESGSAMIGA